MMHLVWYAGRKTSLISVLRGGILKHVCYVELAAALSKFVGAYDPVCVCD